MKCLKVEIVIKYYETYNYSKDSIKYLDEISKKLNIEIQHAENGGEKQLLKYWLDGYIEKYNIGIEWNDPQHYKKSERNKDSKRKNYIFENFGTYIVEVNQIHFYEDIELGIQKVIREIQELIILRKNDE